MSNIEFADNKIEKADYKKTITIDDITPDQMAQIFINMEHEGYWYEGLTAKKIGDNKYLLTDTSGEYKVRTIVNVKERITPDGHPYILRSGKWYQLRPMFGFDDSYIILPHGDGVKVKVYVEITGLISIASTQVINKYKERLETAYSNLKERAVEIYKKIEEEQQENDEMQVG